MGKLGGLVLGLVVVAAVVPACTESASAPKTNPPFTDGTRLKAVHHLIDGGPSLFVNWYDTQLGVDCSFINGRFPDQPVCFPEGVDQPAFAQDAYLFTDSSCSTPVVGSQHPGESRYFIRWPDDDAGCGAFFRLFQVGQVVPSGTPLFGMNASTGACGPAAETLVNSFSELRLRGPEIPVDTLVRGTVRHDAGAGRIVPLAIAGDDGSIQGAVATETEVIAWDNERDEIVSVPTWIAPGSRWFPASMFDASYFSDAACTTHAALGSGCQTVPKACAVSRLEACRGSTPTEIFDLGPPLGGRPPLYRPLPSNLTCQETTLGPVSDPEYQMFTVGAAVPLTSFAEAIEVRSGTGQLRVVQAGSPGGSAMAGVRLFDSVHGQLCSFSVAAADGVVRCIPKTADTGPYFADEACSAPIVVTLPAADCTPAPTLASRHDPAEQAAGGQGLHIYPIGVPYVGTVYFLLQGSGCIPFGDAAVLGPGQRFTTGPEIPATEFAPANLVRPNPR